MLRSLLEIANIHKDVKPGRLVTVRFKVEIAFMNEKCPSFFQRRPVYVCFVAETSDGRLIDFRRLRYTNDRSCFSTVRYADDI